MRRAWDKFRRRAAAADLSGWQGLMVLGVLGAALSVARLVPTVSALPGIDYALVWTVQRTVADGSTVDPYTDEFHQRAGPAALRRLAALPLAGPHLQTAAAHWTELPVTGSPLLFAALSPLATADYDAAVARHRLLLLACWLAATLYLGRRLGAPWLHTVVLVLLSVQWFAPLASDLHAANVNALQLALLATFVGLRSRAHPAVRDGAAGLWMGLCVAFKPSFMLVLPLLVARLLFRRQWQPAGVLATSGAGGLLAGLSVGAAYFGSLDVVTSWVRRLAFLGETRRPVAGGNIALNQFADEVLHVRPGAVVAAAMIALLVSRAWRERAQDGTRADVEFPLVVLALVPPLVLVNTAWEHYLLLLWPALLWLLFTPGRWVHLPLAGTWWLMVAQYPLNFVLGPTRATVTAALVALVGVFVHGVDAAAPAGRR